MSWTGCLKHRRIRLMLLCCIIAGFIVGCSNDDLVKEKTIQPHRTTIEQGFVEEAMTHYAKSYVLTLPHSGQLAVITTEVGDHVHKNQVLAAIDLLPVTLNVISKENSVQQAVTQLNAEEARLAEAMANHDHYDKVLKRQRELSQEGHVSSQQIEEHEWVKHTAMQRLKDQAQRVAGQKIQVKNQRIALKLAKYNAQQGILLSPIDGVVVKRFTAGNHYASAGSQLLSVVEPNRLDIQAEVLSAQALDLKLGAVVLLGVQYGDYTLKGKVKQLYPEGFSKRSPLGTQEQRVKVIIALEDRLPENIGGNYRLYAKFIVKQKKDALSIPRYSVLEDAAGDHYVFKYVEGKLQKQIITVGIASNTQIEVLSGLSAKDLIIKTPNALMKSGDAL